MLAKFGLLFLVLLFGACMFLAGMAAPSSWHQGLSGVTSRLARLWTAPSASTAAARDHAGASGVGHAAATASAAASSAPSSASSASSAATTATTATTAAASGSTRGAASPPRLDTLLVASQVASAAPKQGAPVYALQVGLFVSDQAASDEQAHASRAGIGLPMSRVRVRDATGAPWTLLAAGRFPSVAQAQQAAARVASLMGMRHLSVVRLPDASGKPPAEEKAATGP